jgi:cell wall-associated NlpC family hydrolase
VTAKQINQYLKRQGSPLAGYGNAFVRAGRNYGVSPALLVAISGAESSFGKINSGSNNPFGWGPGIDFPSWQDAIQTVAKGLRNGYLNEGRTSIQAIGAKWAPQGASNDPTNLNSNWVTNVQKFMQELGGGMPATASQSAPNALGGTNTGSGNTSSPGATPAFPFPELASGQFDPLKSLEALTMSVASGAVLDKRGSLTPPTDTQGNLPTPRRGGAGAQSVISFAHAQIGQPYVWGGESRSEGGFDCSGLIQAAYAKAGISIPRTTWTQMKSGKSVRWNQLQPGDLVFSNGGKHVVMYVGNGKVIAAPHRGTVVQYQPLARFKSSFVSARRYL